MPVTSSCYCEKRERERDVASGINSNRFTGDETSGNEAVMTTVWNYIGDLIGKGEGLGGRYTPTRTMLFDNPNLIETPNVILLISIKMRIKRILPLFNRIYKCLIRRKLKYGTNLID